MIDRDDGGSFDGEVREAMPVSPVKLQCEIIDRRRALTVIKNILFAFRMLLSVLFCGPRV